MVLSERDRRVLAEIDRQLAAADPRFVRSMRRRLPRPGYGTRVFCTVVAVAAGLSAVLCLALALLGPAVAAGLLAAAALYVRPNPPPRAHQPIP